MKKVLTSLVWFDSALFAVAFAMPAWCLWLSHYFIRRSTYCGQPVPEGAADVLEKISFYFSQAVAPLLFLLLLICLFFYCSRWTQYVCHAYFTVAAGFLLMFLARWVPVIDLRGIGLSSILFYMARGDSGFQFVLLSGPVCSLVFLLKSLYVQKRRG